uniref:Uncharacterized protein n=1 Tax=Streptomyces sp. NBC_00093 TaxID=2975649 RepID=A0AAU2A246_9ACTN
MPARVEAASVGPWPPALLPGLWVDLGDWHTKRQVWLKLPSARFTCRHGCPPEQAFGEADVTAFTARITTDHARACPGPNRQDHHG